MFEKEESEDLLIEWDHPKPTRVMPHLNNRTDIWYKRLRPFAKAPGRRGRVHRGLTKQRADMTRNNMIRSLRNHDPYQKWKIETGKEDDSTFSIWVTFEGRMNEEEYQQSERDRYERGEKMRRQMLKAKLSRQQDVARSALSGSLRPPRER